MVRLRMRKLDVRYWEEALYQAVRLHNPLAFPSIVIQNRTVVVPMGRAEQLKYENVWTYRISTTEQSKKRSETSNRADLKVFWDRRSRLSRL